MRVQLLSGACRVSPFPFPVPAGHASATFARGGPPGAPMAAQAFNAGPIEREAVGRRKEPHIAAGNARLRGHNVGRLRAFRRQASGRVNLRGHGGILSIFEGVKSGHSPLGICNLDKTLGPSSRSMAMYMGLEHLEHSPFRGCIPLSLWPRVFQPSSVPECSRSPVFGFISGCLRLYPAVTGRYRVFQSVPAANLEHSGTLGRFSRNPGFLRVTECSSGESGTLWNTLEHSFRQSSFYPLSPVSRAIFSNVIWRPPPTPALLDPVMITR